MQEEIDLELWWEYVQERLKSNTKGELAHNQRFFDDLRKVAAGKTITATEFIIAHAMWYGEGEINSDIFDDCKEKKLAAINSNGCKFENIITFLIDYLDQCNLTFSALENMVAPKKSGLKIYV